MSLIVGISMPRCGHHFVERLLRAAYDGIYDYCDFYTRKECCKAVPCKRNASLTRQRTRVFYQKNHDVDLALPRKIDCDMMLVQYRDPLDQSLANFDNYVRVFGHSNSACCMPYFLAANAWYYIRFFRKWIDGSSNDVFLLKYEELSDNPLETIREIARRISTPISEAKLEERAPTILRTGAAGNTFVRREYTKHRFFDKDIFAATERILFDNCKGLDYVPKFQQTPDDGTWTLMRILLASEMEKASPVERARLLRLALEIRPDMRNVVNELALTLLTIGKKDEAVSLSEQALALDARNPASLHVRGIIAFAMGDYCGAQQCQELAIALGGAQAPYVAMLEQAKSARRDSLHAS